MEKVICQKLLQVSSREEYKLQLCTLLLPVTFLLAHFLHFSQQFRNQRKILSFLDTYIQVLWRKSFYVILALFETLKPYSQEMAQNFEKLVLQKCLRIAFYTYIPVNLHHFPKNHHNHCTLRDTLACGGGGVSSQTKGQTLWYSRYICDFCLFYITKPESFMIFSYLSSPSFQLSSSVYLS
jgi:hypothetical protein